MIKQPEWFCALEDCIFHVVIERADLEWIEVNTLISGRQSYGKNYYCDSCVKKARINVQSKGKA